MRGDESLDQVSSSRDGGDRADLGKKTLGDVGQEKLRMTPRFLDGWMATMQNMKHCNRGNFLIFWINCSRLYQSSFLRTYNKDFNLHRDQKLHIY